MLFLDAVTLPTDVIIVTMIDWPLYVQVIVFTLVTVALILPPLYVWQRYRLPVLSFFDRYHWFSIFTTISVTVLAMEFTINAASDGSLTFFLLLVYPATLIQYLRYRSSYRKEIDAYRQQDAATLGNIYDEGQKEFKEYLKGVLVSLIVGLLVIGLYLV